MLEVPHLKSTWFKNRQVWNSLFGLILWNTKYLAKYSGELMKLIYDMFLTCFQQLPRTAFENNTIYMKIV